MKIEYKTSFTLAEVLITLVIVGIIAAVTVPMIIQNHKKVETAAKLKKVYSTLKNAVKLSEIDHGVPFEEWGIFDSYSEEESKKNFNEYFSKYLNYADGCSMIDDDHGYNSKSPVDMPFNCYTLTDGIEFGFNPWFDVIVDINGSKGPNEAGRDMFYFDLTDSWPNEHYYTRERYIESCAQSWNENGSPWRDPDPGVACTWLLVTDGWEFTKDYKKRL